jgi:DNA replication protein DnaC
VFDLEGIRRIAEIANPRNPGDYEKDGLLYCHKCNTPKQCRCVLPWKTFIAPCMCQCETEKYNQEKEEKAEAERLDAIKNLRVNGINDTSVRSMTFDVDDRRDAKKSDLARRYVSKWNQLYRENVGLLFYGNTGNGKTFTAACIANALIDMKVPVLMTSFSKIIKQITGMRAEDKIEYLSSINRYDLLILDDLGAERESQYALEIVYDVVDSRYKSGKPMIVTTNLTMAEMKNPISMDYQRIYDRILEMCMQIHFDGESRRKDKAKDKLAKARDILLSSD